MSVMYNWRVNGEGAEIPRKNQEKPHSYCRAAFDSFVKYTHAAELLIAFYQKLRQGKRRQFAEIAQQIDLENVAHLPGVTMGASQRFGNDVVDDAQLEEIARGELQGAGGQRFGFF